MSRLNVINIPYAGLCNSCSYFSYVKYEGGGVEVRCAQEIPIRGPVASCSTYHRSNQNTFDKDDAWMYIKSEEMFLSPPEAVRYSYGAGTLAEKMKQIKEERARKAGKDAKPAGFRND